MPRPEISVVAAGGCGPAGKAIYSLLKLIPGRAKGWLGPRGFEQLEDLGAELGDIACSQGQDHVARAGSRGYGGCGVLKRGDVGGGLAGSRGDAASQHLTRDPRNGRFAGGVDIQHEHGVCSAEGGAELLHERLGAGVAMRLEDRVDAAVTALARGGKSGADFSGVMGVVVNDSDAAHLSLNVEAAVHAAKALQGCANIVRANVESDTNGNGCGGVPHIVSAGDVQAELAQIAIAKMDVEAAEGDGSRGLHIACGGCG